MLGIAIFVIYGMVFTLTPYGNADGDGFDVNPHCIWDDAVGNDHSEGYCGGKHGPGAFVVTLTTMITAVVVYFVKMLKYFNCPDRIEMKRREDHVTMNERTSSFAGSMQKENPMGQ